MKVAEKLDWLEYSVLYTKNPNLIRPDTDLLDEIEIHKHKFGDRLVAAFLRDPNYIDSENKKLVKQFCEWVVPEEWKKYFDFGKYKILPYSVRGYAFSIEIGDGIDFSFIVRIPMKYVTKYEENANCYCVQNVKTNEFMTLNPLIGYKIVFSGSNIPTIRKKIGNDKENGTLYPVRFDVENWVIKLQVYNTCAKLGRVDIALDLGIDFNIIAKMWQKNPRQFKTPYFKENCRLDYNPYSGAGAICCGKRGSANDSYLRIYNKSQEVKEHLYDFYPFDNPDFDKIVPDCLNANKSQYEVPWTRIEFELRNSTAIHFLCDYFDSCLDDDTIGHFVFDYIGIYKIETDQEKKYCENGQYCYMSFSSLWNDVIKSYNLYAEKESENFVQFREELESKDYSSSAASIRWLYRKTPYRTGLRLYKSVNRSLQAFDVSKNGSGDCLKRISETLASADDVVKLITLIPLDFADAATKERLKHISECCCISKERASEMLNEAGMKGYFKNIIEKLKVFEYNSVYEINTNDFEDATENSIEFDFCKEKK